MKMKMMMIIVMIVMVVMVMMMLFRSDERYMEERILGTWGNDQNLRVTFTDDRGKVLIDEPGKKVKTAYFVMTAPDKGVASSGIDKKWTFSLVDSSLKWTTPAGETTDLKKM